MAVGLLALGLLFLLPSKSAGGNNNYDDPFLQMLIYEKYFNAASSLCLPSLWACALVSLVSVLLMDRH